MEIDLPLSPQYVGKYKILSVLGHGPSGVVYKGIDPENDNVVAVKVLKTIYLGDDLVSQSALDRFKQETKRAGSLVHPNIVAVYDADRSEDGSPFLVTEYIEGVSLDTILEKDNVVDPRAALHYLAQIASAVDYAHSQKVIHRDLKPSALLVDERHKLYLLDFGVAVLGDTSTAVVQMGTPSYMSPEQIRGATLDGLTDIFSLGIVAFEMFTGAHPFPARDFTTVVSAVLHNQPPSFAELGVDLSVKLEMVLARGLEKERVQRFSCALEFIDALADVFGVEVEGSGLVGGCGDDVSDEKVVLSGATAGGSSTFVENLAEEVTESSQSGQASDPYLDPDLDPDPESFVGKIDDVFDQALKKEEEIVEIVESKSGHKLGIIVAVVLLAIGGWGIYGLLSPSASRDLEVASLEVTTEVAPVVDETLATNAKLDVAENGLEEIEGFINDLKSPEYLKRIQALKGLRGKAGLSTPRVLDAVIERLSDEDELVRGFAVETLGGLKTDRVRDVLQKRLEKESSPVVIKVIIKQLDRASQVGMGTNDI